MDAVRPLQTSASEGAHTNSFTRSCSLRYIQTGISFDILDLLVCQRYGPESTIVSWLGGAKADVANICASLIEFTAIYYPQTTVRKGEVGV